MDNDKLQELERLAKAATPGPWKFGKFGGVYLDHAPGSEGMEYGGHGLLSADTPSGALQNGRNNEIYAAAANPAAMQELIDAARESRARVAELEAAVAPARPAPAVDAGELPLLPRPACTYADHSYPAFNKIQMHAYARAAIAQQAAPASAPPVDAAGERAAFEAWVRETMRKNIPWASEEDIQSHLQRSGFNSDHYLTREQEWKGWQARAALAAQRQAASADTELLKWMAEHGAHIAWSMDGESCNVWLPAERDGTEGRPAEGYPQKHYGDWRQAIDAAIAARAAG